MTAGPFEVRITVERRDPDGIAGTVLSEVALTGDDVRALLIAANHAASSALTWHPVTRLPHAAPRSPQGAA